MSAPKMLYSDLPEDINTGDFKEHHYWCNFFTRRGPCAMCDRFYAKFPGPPEEELRKHFPEVIRR